MTATIQLLLWRDKKRAEAEIIYDPVVVDGVEGDGSEVGVVKP